MSKMTRTILAGALFLGFATVSASSLSAQGRPANAAPPVLYETQQGLGSIQFDLSTLGDYGIRLSDETGRFEGDKAVIAFLLPQNSSLGIVTLDRNFGTFTGGSVQVNGQATLTTQTGERLPIQNARLVADEGTAGSAWTLISNGVEIFRFYSSALLELDPSNNRMHWGGVDVVLAHEAAVALDKEPASGAPVGTFTIEASIRATGTAAGSEVIDEHPVSEGGTNPSLTSGPDVIVGDLPSATYWGASGGIKAYSVGTTSCNIGDTNLNWFSNTNQHPVIGQNLYRWKNGRFEMIGQSWLKHGFFALSQGLCFNDCQSTNGTQLGVHCSDPYTAGLNGDRGRLGPKYQVNAATGAYPYPPNQPASNGTIGRRLQVASADVDPAQNSGARYFVEGHYVTPDDSAAGNALNNASYREVVLSGGNPNLSTIGSTVREQPAINVAGGLAAGLPDIDGLVAGKEDVANDGRFTVISYARDLGNGFWRYEYAVHNLNSDRSGQAFTVGLPTGALVQNQGFHDVNYHSGEIWSNTDWSISINTNDITWATSTFAQNNNANALRWSTLYNFYFDTNVAPVNGTANLTLFKPGTPGDIDINARIPMQSPPGDTPDLALMNMQVDYDTVAGGTQPGPGALGQAADIVLTIRNNGNVEITSADFTVDANVVGGGTHNLNAIITDFDAAGGIQTLAAGATTTVRLSYGAGVLDRCGTYALIASHDPANLQWNGMGGSMFGDVSTANDSLEDHPDDQSDPGDQFSPDLLELDFGTIIATVIPASVIIEDSNTEKVRVDIDFTGLGPGGDAHDVRLIGDLTDINGVVQYLSVFSVSRNGVSSAGNALRRIRLDVAGLFPAPSPGQVFRVRLRLRDLNSTEFCLETLTTNTTTLQ